MLGLNQDTVTLITAVAVIHMIPFLGIMATAMLARQVGRFGFTHSWGNDARDININGF